VEEGKILIVEDQPDLAEVLSYRLNSQGFTTLFATDGLTGCRLAGSETPDLILLDVLLPDLDGWEICRLIRSRREDDIGSVPIIMLTALNSMNDRLKGLEIGADAYIAKPYSIREVILTARRLIERRRREQSLNKAINRLQARSDHSKTVQDILYHELRNQLLILRGSSVLLGRGTALPEDRSQTCIQAIERSTQSLGNLAESLLLLSRQENEGLTLPPDHPEVSLLAREIISFYQPFADQRRMKLHLHSEQTNPNPAVNGVYLKVILSNLVENAVKYAPEETNIDVRLSTPPGTRLEVAVEDRGDGIPEKERDLVFNRFARGTTAAETVPGRGLGLYIARLLARAMGGEVHYEAPLSGVNRFTVIFPLRP
jgi:two-component system sensor histidine kinase/response regulator